VPPRLKRTLSLHSHSGMNDWTFYIKIESESQEGFLLKCKVIN